MDQDEIKLFRDQPQRPLLPLKEMEAVPRIPDYKITAKPETPVIITTRAQRGNKMPGIKLMP